MLRFSLFILQSIVVFGLAAQFDTIGGSYIGTLDLTASEDRVYTATYDNAGIIKIRTYTGEEIYDPGLLIFSGANITTLTDIVVHQGDLYVSALKNPVSNGSFVYHIDSPGTSDQTISTLLETPWPVGAITLRDNIMYLARAEFFGGGLFTFDIDDPEAELELFLEDGFSNFDQALLIVNNQLLFTSAGSGGVYSVDLDAASPSLSLLIGNLDTPRGMDFDNGLLYVTVANSNSNSSSAVYVYPFENGQAGPLQEIVAQNTELVLFDVARLKGRTYVLESAIDLMTPPGYLLRLEAPSSVRSRISMAKAKVFPNPTNGLVSVEGQRPLRVEAVDLLGRYISLPAINNARIDLSGLKPGIYNLLLELEDGTSATARVAVVNER